MAYPAGTTLATINVAGVLDFFNGTPRIDVEVSPVLAGEATHITHAATGVSLIEGTRFLTPTTGEGGSLTFQVPHADLPGWVAGGREVPGWAYRVKITARVAGGTVTTIEKTIRPLSSQAGVIEFGLIPEGDVVMDAHGDVPLVLSWAGLSGHITMEQIEALGIIGGGGGSGTDGVSVTSIADTDGDGIATITYSNGTTEQLPLPEGPPGAPGAPGADGRGVTSITDTDADGTATILYSDGLTDPLPLPEGPKGDPGADGSPGAPGADGRGVTSVDDTDADGVATVTYTDGLTDPLPLPRGPKGDMGTGLEITGSVATTADLSTLSPAPVKDDAYVVQDTGLLHIYDGTNWSAGIPFKGDQGDPGVPGDPGTAATVTAGTTTTTDPGTPAAVKNNGSTSAAVLDFTIPRGADGAPGAPGADGRGVTSIADPDLDGTATITYTDGLTAPLPLPEGPKGDPGADGSPGAPGADGRGVTSILDTDADGIATVTYTDGLTDPLPLPEGPKGDPGEPGTTDWAGITNTPETFTPSIHGHSTTEITDASGVNVDDLLAAKFNAAGGSITGRTEIAPVSIGDTGEAAFRIDATTSGLSSVPAFKVSLPASGERKAFQLTSGTDPFAWASFEWQAGGTNKPGFALGPGGGSTRDTNLYRDAANSLRTDDQFTANGVNANGNKVTGVAAPTADTDAATQGWTNTQLEGKASTTQAVPAGGTTGQVLSKNAADDYAITWADLPASGSATPDVYRRPRLAELTWAKTTQTMTPRSVGSDGYVYGSPTNGALNPMRSNDGLATATYATNPTTWADPPAAGLNLSSVWQTSTGFLSIFTSSGADTAYIYHAPTWGGVWTRVLTAGYMQDISIGRGPTTPLNGTQDSLCLLAEYGNQDARNAYISEDGGLTWTVLTTRNRVPEGTGVNNHIHNVSYDRFMDAIWLTQGDGPNCWIGYTTDKGQTWTDVPAVGAGPEVAGALYNHPTILAPTSAKIVTTPDGAGANGIWGINRETLVTSVDHEIQRQDAYKAWAHAPWAQRGDDELYIAWVPDTGVTPQEAEETVIAGTGDGGQSWYTLSRIPHRLGVDNWAMGIVGPDAGNRMYVMGKTNNVSETWVATAPGWDNVSQNAVLESTRDRVFYTMALPQAATPNVETPTRDVLIPRNYVAAGDVITIDWIGTAANPNALDISFLLKVRMGNTLAWTDEISSSGDIYMPSGVTSLNYRATLRLFALQNGRYRWIYEVSLGGSPRSDYQTAVNTGEKTVSREQIHYAQMRLRTMTTDPSYTVQIIQTSARIERAN